MSSASRASKYASTNGKVQPTGKSARTSSTKLSFFQILQLARRLAVLAAAIVYIYTSIAASTASVTILSGKAQSAMHFPADSMSLIGKYMGASTIRESPLLVSVLSNATTPRNSTVYIESDAATSTTGCSTPRFSSAVYGNAFLRTFMSAFVRDTAYNLTFLVTSELVVPVVDCSSTPLVAGDSTLARLFYLMREKANPESVYLLALSLSLQDYSIPKQIQNGPGGIMSIAKIADMRASVPYYFSVSQGYPFGALKFQVYLHVGYTADYRWRLASIPVVVIAETSKEVVTARRTGFYMATEMDQSNVKNMYWSLDPAPLDAISKWRWQGGTVLRDAWAWVHFIHIFFAADALFNLGVLFLVVYRNLQTGKIWVGDAFVSISNSLAYRGSWVLLSWIVNNFWTVMEFMLDTANTLANEQQEIYALKEITRADMMTIYLSLVSVLGLVLRERVDPALAIFLFKLGFDSRYSFATIFPASLANIKDFAVAELASSIQSVSETVALTTPLRFWTIHSISSRESKFIISSLVPIFSTSLLVIVYALARKVYRRFYPDQVRRAQATSYSDNKEAMEAQRGNLTLFEIATGAALQSRLGLVSDYANCKYIKGMKFASADGIYCSGYVIANGKFLVASADLMSIVVMKVTRLRFRNIYAYEVSGSTVQQTARLVYPQTLSWVDLVHLNVSILQ